MLSLSELDETLPDTRIAHWVEDRELSHTISAFLRTEKPDARNVFIRRYWFFDSVRAIAQRYGFSESKVKSMLFHTRNRMKQYLEKEGFTV